MWSGPTVSKASNATGGQHVRVDGDQGGDSSPVFDRRLLLFGDRREAELDLWEVQRYGADSWGDSEFVCVYGMRPTQWYARGIRLLGRTVVECTRDRLAAAIGKDVAALAGSAPSSAQALVIDPFAGSGNTLYWILRQMPGATGLGVEIDPAIYRLTRRNLALAGSPLEVLNLDYVAALADLKPRNGQLVVVFVAPPWGDALDPVVGLDLRRTQPPVAGIVDTLVRLLPNNPLLVAIQVVDRVEPESFAEVLSRFEWSTLHLFDLNPTGENPGVLLGTVGWAPS